MAAISTFINRLPEAQKQVLDRLVTVKDCAKGEIVCWAGRPDDTIYYVVSGMLRKYVVRDGDERTLDFFFTDDVYFPVAPAPVRQTDCFLQALEKTTIYKLNNHRFEEVKRENAGLQQLETAILEMAYAQALERLLQFQTMNATERYLALLDRDPRIVQNIPLKLIASYLGINNASLSKIRATIKDFGKM